jgi:hypothetical protein
MWHVRFKRFQSSPVLSLSSEFSISAMQFDNEKKRPSEKEKTSSPVANKKGDDFWSA